jgi:hypothetical protein
MGGKMPEEEKLPKHISDMLGVESEPDTETETPTGDTETETVEETPKTEEAETTDTETETPKEEDTETETVEEDPLITAFREAGLDKKYADPITALRSIPERDRFAQQTSQERAALMRQLELAQSKSAEPDKPQITGQEFFDDPLGSLKKAGYVSAKEAIAIAKQEGQQEMDQTAAEDFVNSTSDFEEYRADADRVLNEMPYLVKLPKLQMVKTCYEVAKARRAKPVEVTEPANQDKKGRAATSGGTGGAPAKSKPKVKPLGPHGLSAEDFKNKPLREIEETVGFGDN